jgi:uncharacterized protein YdeI (BOF family)
MNKKLLSMTIATLVAAGSASSAALAQSENHMLKSYEDDTSITLSGTVVEARSDEFDMLVNDDTITVEVDEQFRDGGAYSLLAGDSVTVSGRVDDDLFEGRELEADALYIEKLGASFVLDDDYVEKYGMVSGRDLTGFIEVAGNVTSVSDDADEFRIHTGVGDFTVEVDELDINPIDDEGLTRLRPGDWVSVLGEVDSDWLEGREIVASNVHLVRLDLVID